MRRLAVLLALVCGLATMPVADAQTAVEQEWDLVAAINRSRFEDGLPPLVVLDGMRLVARAWSTRMAVVGRLSHNPDFVGQVRAVVPGMRAVAENVAYARSPGRVHELWLTSPGHRRNMHGPYRYIGAGAAGALWATALFADAPAGLRGITRVPVRRLAGTDALHTAIEVSRTTVPAGSADAVAVARADVFADALVGGPLAGAGGGSVLLTGQTDVPDAVVQEARRVLRPTGTVYLMGGPGALSPTVEAAFLAAGMRVQRVAGRDRYDTAAQAATLLNASPREVLLASGESFPDALSAGVPAAVHRMPILLTPRDALPPSTALYLAARPAVRRSVIGGRAALSDGAARQAGATERIAGANRYATAVAVARRWFPAPAHPWVAGGDRHQDALVAVPAAARARQPLLLVPGAGEAALYAYSREHLGRLTGATAVGGQSSVAEPALSLLFN